MAKKIVLISCTKKKLSQPEKAKNIYMPSAYFRKMRAFAEKFGDVWFILSAKHHLLNPEEIIEPYHNYLGSFNKVMLKKWADIVISELSTHVDKGDEVTLIAGKKYVEYIIIDLQHMDLKVKWPIEGMRIGEQMHWLDIQTSL